MPTPPQTLLVVLDVDGVCRMNVDAVAETSVVKRVNDIIRLHKSGKLGAGGTATKLRVVFLSGSHSSIVDPPESPKLRGVEWRTPNKPLAEVFAGSFDESLFADGTVRILGQLGSDTATGSPLAGKNLARLAPEVRIALLQIVLASYAKFLLETKNLTDDEHRAFTELLAATTERALSDASSVSELYTPDTFDECAAFIRARTGGGIFRLVSHASTAEIGGAPLRAPVDLRVDGLRVVDYVQAAVAAHADDRIRELADRVSGGIAHLRSTEFLWCTVTLSSKGRAVTELQRKFSATAGDGGSDVATLTIGDSKVDFSMHELGTAAFHVGPPSTLEMMRQREPGKYDHVTFVPLDKCRGDSHGAAHHGSSDVQALCTGTDEVLDRLLEALAAASEAADADAAAAAPDLKSILRRVAASFAA